MEEDGWGVWRIGEGEWINQLRRERKDRQLSQNDVQKVLTVDMRNMFSFHTGKGGDIQERWGVGRGGHIRGRGRSGLGSSRTGLVG